MLARNKLLKFYKGAFSVEYINNLSLLDFNREIKIANIITQEANDEINKELNSKKNGRK